MARWAQWRCRGMAPLVSLILAAVALLPASVRAQPLAGEGGAGRGGGRPEHLELLFMWRLVDELELDEAQAAKVFPAFRRHRAERDTLEQRHRALLDGIDQELKDGAADDVLQASIRRTRALEVEMERADRAFHDELGKLLTTRQQARMLLFDSRFRTDLQDMVRRVRAARNEAGEGGPPWPEGPPGRGPRLRSP